VLVTSDLPVYHFCQHFHSACFINLPSALHRAVRCCGKTSPCPEKTLPPWPLAARAERPTQRTQLPSSENRRPRRLRMPAGRRRRRKRTNHEAARDYRANGCSGLGQAPQPALLAEPGMYVEASGGLAKIVGQIAEFKRSGSRFANHATIGIKTRKENIQLLGLTRRALFLRSQSSISSARQESDAGVSAAI